VQDLGHPGSGRPAGGERAQQRHRHSRQGQQGEPRGVEDPESTFGHVVPGNAGERLHQGPVNRHPDRQAEQPAGGAEDHSAGGDHGQNLGRRHAQRLQHRRVAGTLASVQQERVEDTRHRDQGQDRGQHQHHRVQDSDH
jgi:hypothetical protein